MPFGVHGGNCCLRERSDPTIGRPHRQRKPRRRGDAYGTVDHGEKLASESENVHRDSAAAAARLRTKLCDDMQQPPVKRGMSSIVFATANITSTDPRQSAAKRSVGLNCTGRMAESEAQFSAAVFHVVAVQEGRMPSRTVSSGNTHRMHVIEGVGTTHSLGLQLWVHNCLFAAIGPVTVVSPQIMCLNLKMHEKRDTIRIEVINAHAPHFGIEDDNIHDQLYRELGECKQSSSNTVKHT